MQEPGQGRLGRADARRPNRAGHGSEPGARIVYLSGGIPWRMEERSVRKVPHSLYGTFRGREELAARPWLGCSVEAVQAAARVNVTCVTPLGEEVASTS